MLPPRNAGRILQMENLVLQRIFFFVCVSSYVVLKILFHFSFFFQKEMFLYLLGKQHAKIIKTVRILISFTYQDMDIDFEYRNVVNL